MLLGSRSFRDLPAARTFDVVCAGYAFWNVSSGAVGRSGLGAAPVRAARGALGVSLALAREGLRVGVATVVEDDRMGRALVDRVAAGGVDVGGVTLVAPRAGLVLAHAGDLGSIREDEPPLAVPEGWSAQVLLLSGLSPVVSHAAALCKAARAARRAGTVVVVDVNAPWHLWAGRDARAVRMILREADAVWCSAEDLVGLNLDVASLRAALRVSAVLVASDGAGTTWALGPFGEVHHRSEDREAGPTRGDDSFATAICAELARAGHAGESAGDLWARALRRGHAVSRAS